MSAETSLPDIRIVSKSKPKQEKKVRRVPPFHVVLENDDHHSFEFVVGVLQKSLGYAAERAMRLTMEAHSQGRAIVWTGPKEVAELKVSQIRTFHEIRAADKAHLGPLGCSIEPASGS